MQSDPIIEWQRLTEHYRGLQDEALCELALDINDLTETAQHALRQELQSRGFSDPVAALKALRAPAQAEPGFDPANTGTSNEHSADHDASPALEYTWKTELCACEDGEHAWQLSEMLRRAGLQSWIEGAGSYSTFSGADLGGGPRLLVAADQLNEARSIAAKPIPQDIIDLSKAGVPEYEPPVCPKCGASNPILENAEPTNEWLCEACGAEWTDPLQDHAESPE